MNNSYIGYTPLKKLKFCLSGEYLHADLLQLIKTKLSHKYVLVMVDKFTGFVWLTPLASKNATKIVDHIFNIITQFGFPRIIKTNNSRELVNKLIDQNINIIW